jgi:hypothetical protein
MLAVSKTTGASMTCPVRNTKMTGIFMWQVGYLLTKDISERYNQTEVQIRPAK